jgi:hypothetical protein
VETLVQIAKRLGIKPNPAITDEAYLKIKEQMLQEINKMGKFKADDLTIAMYDFHKITPSGIAQQFNNTSFDNNFSRFKKEFLSGIVSHNQAGSFWWHNARKPGEGISERFAADVKLDDPNISSVFKKLDEFILRYQSGYKISSSGNRTDTLNLYMPKSITPEIAKEFYNIVKPVLQTKNHEYLDGFAITQNGQEIKGIKFGPEPLVDPSDDEFRSMKNRLKSIFPPEMLYDITRNYKGQKSLGEIAAKAQLCDLFYYLVGREGQNPIQLGNQLGDPNIRYSKKLDISGDVLSQKEKNNLQPKKEEYPKTVSIPQKEELPTDMTALLEQLQLMRKEVHSIRTDVTQLRQSNAQLKQNLTSLRQENSLLRKQNNRLASTGMKR